MKFKDLLLPLALAFSTTWLIHYFFFSGSTSDEQLVRSGQTFKAPKTKQELKPLNTEVDFLDIHRQKPAQLSEVSTQWAVLVFSTDGASLERLEFKQVNLAGGGSLRTISAPAETERENRCFLVALAEKTPFYYDLISRQDLETKTELIYQAQFPDGVIEKKFTIYKHTFKIDLDLKVDAKQASDVELEPESFSHHQ